MKKAVILLGVLFAALLLVSCAKERASTTAVRVSIMEGEHYTVAVGTEIVEPGEDVSFLIRTDRGFTVTGTDYSGEYGVTQTGGLSKLELKNVRRPTRVNLTVTRYSCTIRYSANGGDALTAVGKSAEISYDIRTHTRPNVSIGTDLFARDGYTLIGWNTEPDGSGLSVGLGSRMSVEDTAELYAQWAEWTAAEYFTCEPRENGTAITSCSYPGDTLVIPETLDGVTVTEIAGYALANCPAKTVILPKTIAKIKKYAFDGAKLSELCFFDNVEYIADDCFTGCGELSTLHINAIEDPYGYSFRRESMLADKFDLLINTMGEDRLIFYGGCSMWYNLIGGDVAAEFGDRYTVVNMAVNGVASSLIQMEIMRSFVTERDVLVHTPEISSRQQLLEYTALSDHDDKIWCALEYNYDLVSLVDIRVFDGGVFDSLRKYLDKKKPGGTYSDVYTNRFGYYFFDETGSIPFYRDTTAEKLLDNVRLDPAYLEDLSRLEEEYRLFMDKGVTILVSYACIDIDQVPEEQQGNIAMMGELFGSKFSAMEGVTVISRIDDFIYHDSDFYDTVYHLLTEPAKRCTAVWIRDLKAVLDAE